MLAEAMRRQKSLRLEEEGQQVTLDHLRRGEKGRGGEERGGEFQGLRLESSSLALGQDDRGFWLGQMV